MVEFFEDDVEFFECGSDLADDWVVCCKVECLVGLDEGGGGLHIDKGFFGLLTLNMIFDTSTPFSMTYLAQEISSLGTLYFFSKSSSLKFGII